MGLKAGSSVPDGGCSFTAMDCSQQMKTTFLAETVSSCSGLIITSAQGKLLSTPAGETKAVNFLTADLWSRRLEVYVGDGDGG